MPTQAQTGTGRREHEPLKADPPVAPSAGNAKDPALQQATTTSTAPVGQVFDGIGQGIDGFQVSSAPPDTTGAAGATQFVQWVNTSFAVYDKAGVIQKGPVGGNTLFANLGGPCAANNDGDPIVQYDRVNQRWVLTQFQVTTKPYLQCVAVSQTSDATGAYNLYAYSYGSQDFNDYPKLSVWGNSYIVTYNIFRNGRTYTGPKVCALDRGKMVAGAAAASQQCFQLSSSYYSLLAADEDSPATAGTPALLMSLRSGVLRSWRLTVDWSNAANTKLVGPSTVTGVQAIAAACSSCVPQVGTTQTLDTLGDRLMYRLAYRKVNGVGHLVVNNTVATGVNGSQTAPRWFHLTLADGPTTVPVMQEQGTYAPDASYRWMGSIAMDKVGNIALGYNRSGATEHPSVWYASRSTGDAAGTLGSEVNVISPAGSQGDPSRSLARWGDYSQMTTDPADDCTFFYTTEDLLSSGIFNWNTVVAKFKLPNCA